MRPSASLTLVACVCLAACRRDPPASTPSEVAPPAPAEATPAPGDPLAALGDLSALSPAERRAFEDHGFFEPIAPAGPGMWLHEHPEPGQTFDAYVASEPNRPDGVRQTIYIQPIGELAPELPLALADLERFTEAFFTLPVTVLPPVAMSDTGATIRKFGRAAAQALTTDVMAWLAGRLPPDAYALVAVTLHDIYPEDGWSFVFGQASLTRRVGIYSFARFDDAFYGQPRPEGWRAQWATRAFGVLAHELGHMFGIQHCVFHACVMNGSNSLEESDAQPLRLCPVCLRKLQHTVGFDVAAREEGLLPLYERHGLGELTDWTRRRLVFLRADAATPP